MLATITVEEAQVHLKALIRQVAAGQDIIITENQQPVARLVGEPAKRQSGLRPPPGLGQGMMTILAEDEDHLNRLTDDGITAEIVAKDHAVRQPVMGTRR